MNVLFDQGDNEPVALTKKNNLRGAVVEYLKREGYWNTNYFGDGQRSLTGAQFVCEPQLVKEAFKLFKGLGEV